MKTLPDSFCVAFVYRHRMTSEVLVVDIDRARELDAARPYWQHVSTVSGSDIDHLRSYILELHRILIQSYGNDVQFEKKLKMSILPNKDKEIGTTFTITDIIDDLMLKTVKENIQDIYERLTDWSISEGLVIDFNFKIKK